MLVGGGQECGEHFEIPAGRREVWLPTQSRQSVFGKPEMCVLCNSSEVGVWRYGRALVGNWGDACKRFFFLFFFQKRSEI